MKSQAIKLLVWHVQYWGTHHSSKDRAHIISKHLDKSIENISLWLNSIINGSLTWLSLSAGNHSGLQWLHFGLAVPWGPCLAYTLSWWEKQELLSTPEWPSLDLWTAAALSVSSCWGKDPNNTCGWCILEASNLSENKRKSSEAQKSVNIETETATNIMQVVICKLKDVRMSYWPLTTKCKAQSRLHL